jgi:DnaK suppressor protein
MDTYDDGMAPRFRALLQRREQQLLAMLRDPTQAAAGAGHEVTDFKDIATQESMTAVDEVQAEHARGELQQVVAALARLDSGGYGVCLDCGEAIDLQRLAALPASALCIGCQTVREQGRGAPAH